MKYLLLATILLVGCSETICNFNIDNAFSDVANIVEKANKSFEKAEDTILKIKPDDIIAPNPDPAKCPCKGTGLIKHGDNHVTQCPYHGKSTQTIKR